MSDNHESEYPLDKHTNHHIGYGNPPKHTQFKKGQSGNPKGRPPKRYIHELLEEILNEMVVVNANGEKKKMTRKDVALQQLVNDCMKGKNSSVQNLILLMRSFGKMHPM